VLSSFVIDELLGVVSRKFSQKVNVVDGLLAKMRNILIITLIAYNVKILSRYLTEEKVVSKSLCIASQHRSANIFRSLLGAL
jgi:hypothetical protein